MLALDVLDSVKEHKEAKQYMDNVEKAVDGKGYDDKLDEKRLQEEFQKELSNDIKMDAELDTNVKDSANKNVEKVKEDDIPEEKLDDSANEL